MDSLNLVSLGKDANISSPTSGNSGAEKNTVKEPKNKRRTRVEAERNGVDSYTRKILKMD